MSEKLKKVNEDLAQIIDDSFDFEEWGKQVKGSVWKEFAAKFAGKQLEKNDFEASKYILDKIASKIPDHLIGKYTIALQALVDIIKDGNDQQTADSTPPIGGGGGTPPGGNG